MQNSLNSLTGILEQCFGFSDKPERMTGGLSHEVYSLNKENVIVKVYSKEISSERLQEEENALSLLSESKLINSPKLISSISGQSRIKFNSTLLSCFKKIEGQRKYLLTESPKDLSSIKIIANYLGNLHKEFSLKSKASFAPQESKILEISKSSPLVIESEVNKILQSLLQFNAPYFRTHGDFQQSNILYLEKTISGIIDFEYSTPDFRINDIAGCLSNLLSANQNSIFPEKVISTFSQGYEETFGQSLLELEKDLLQPIVKLIWAVNILWAENMLKQESPRETTDLLQQYHSQTMRCLSN